MPGSPSATNAASFSAGHRFPGEGALLHLEVDRLEKAQVGGDHPPGLEQHDVARHEAGLAGHLGEPARPGCTSALGLESFLSASSACSALASCVMPMTAFKSTTSRMITASETSRRKMEIARRGKEDVDHRVVELGKEHRELRFPLLFRKLVGPVLLEARRRLGRSQPPGGVHAELPAGLPDILLSKQLPHSLKLLSELLLSADDRTIKK